MAAVHSTAASAPRHLRHRPFTARLLDSSRKVAVVSCISTSFVAKPTRRKNYLRQKILRTLKISSIPIDSPKIQKNEELEIQEIQDSETSGNSESGDQEMRGVEVLRQVEMTTPPGGVIVDGNFGKFDKIFYLKYGLWLVGAFVFQSVCAVWLFGSADYEIKNGNFSGNRTIPVQGVGENGQADSRKKLILNVDGQMRFENGVPDSALRLDEDEMGRKIDEIRVMARKVREKERLESKNIDSDEEDDNDADVVKSGIEEEVDNRLLKLRKKLENERDRIPIGSVDHAGKESKRNDNSKENESNEKEAEAALMFKKRYKFKDFPSYQGEKPKGFTRLDDYWAGKSPESGNKEREDKLLRNVNVDNDPVAFDTKETDAVHMVDTVKSESSVELTGSTKILRRKLEKEKGATRKQIKGSAVATPKETDGPTNHGKAAELVKTVESESLEIASVTPHMLSKGNSLAKEKAAARNRSTQKKNSVKRHENDTLWWSRLPYVLGILMHSSDNGAGQAGLYTLKNMSSSDSTNSHIVAFEDTVDATNFCYILQCYFEDMEDFRSDVVPLTVKELNEAVKLEAMRVMVVRRGQLQLYAGQPLTDAENELRAILEEG